MQPSMLGWIPSNDKLMKKTTLPSALATLPLAQYYTDLQKWTVKERNLLLTAPTGTGKSTFLPWFLHKSSNKPQRILVLQPRRLAALGLAHFLSQSISETVGTTVGYRFRLEQKYSPKTQILFSTYGNYLQQLLLQKKEDWDWIIFDELHERRAEMDILLHALQLQGKSAPRLAVLSAALNHEALAPLLKCTPQEIHDPGFPVQVLHQGPQMGEALPRQVDRALKTLRANHIAGTILVILPGKGEIDACESFLRENFDPRGEFEILALHGSLNMAEQQRVFSPAKQQRIILSTNIAETSLTIPQVVAVIDSGWERATDFHQKHEIVQLRLQRISQHNALQRQGRAGRTQAGVCIKLWHKHDERTMNAEIIPEISRMPLENIALQRSALRQKLVVESCADGWITAPPEKAWQKTQKALQNLALWDNKNRINALAWQVLAVPVQNLDLAVFLSELPAPTAPILAAAAIIDQAQLAGNLWEMSQTLVQQPRHLGREVELNYSRLRQWRNPTANSTDFPTFAAEFFHAFGSKLAVANANRQSYATENYSIALSSAQCGDAPAIIPFALLASAGAVQQINTCLFVPISAEILAQQKSQQTWALEWHNRRNRWRIIAVRKNAQVELSRREVVWGELSPAERDEIGALLSRAWLEKNRREDLSHLWWDDATRTLWHQMLWAAKLFPEYNFSTWQKDDWELIYSEFFAGVQSANDLNPQRWRKLLEDYFGTAMLPWLKQNFPQSTVLKSGRRAKYAYPHPEQGVVEISARIGDFVGSHGEHWIAEKRLQVCYDLLAPNFRSAQKTWDLSEFWRGTYADVRKDLRGRYPRHPWPEKPWEV